MLIGLCMDSKLSEACCFISNSCLFPLPFLRGEPAEDFCALSKKWENLCKQHVVTILEKTRSRRSMFSKVEDWNDGRLNEADGATDEFKVSKIVKFVLVIIVLLGTMD